ncbi:MAG: glycosyltransferase [Ardenticatenales bacterium]
MLVRVDGERLAAPKMRIAIVTAAYHTRADDPFVPVWRDMVTALAAMADVTLYPLRRPALGAPFSLDGARIVPLGHGMVRLRRSPFLWRSAISALQEDHRARPFDAVCAFQAGEAGFVAALAAARIGRPLHVHVAGGELVCLRPIGYGSGCHVVERAMVALAMRRASVITTGTKAMAVRAGEWLRSSARGRVHVAPLGIDTARWRALEPRRLADASSGEPVGQRACLVAVSDLRPVKDHATLLEAFAALCARRAVRLDLVGAGETLGATRALAARLGVAQHVRYWGWVPPVVAHVPFLSAHAFVHASRHEAQGIALIEAACLGLPVATTAVGVAGALPGPCRVVQEGDVAALAAAMEDALDAAAAPIEARSADRDTVAAEFDRTRCAERWIHLLSHASEIGTTAQRIAPLTRRVWIDQGDAVSIRTDQPVRRDRP